jgi:hypothetical protein
MVDGTDGRRVPRSGVVVVMVMYGMGQDGDRRDNCLCGLLFTVRSV